MELNGSHVGLTAQLTFKKGGKEVVKVKKIEHVKHLRSGTVELGPTRTGYSMGTSGWWVTKTYKQHYPYNAEVEFVE